MSARARILAITPIDPIRGLREALEKIGDVTCLPDASPEEVQRQAADADAIFTNPNRSKVYLSDKILGAGSRLKVVCTASTGTNHIDLSFAKSRGIQVLSLTEERETINKISSTAEHAFALFLSALRKIPQGWDAVRAGGWDCEPFVGRQVSALTAGVIGYGRLGRFFCRYAQALGAKTLAYDPYQNDFEAGVRSVGLDELLAASDVVSLHVHVTAETTGMLSAAQLARLKPGVIIVNTARGEIVDETALVAFLRKNPAAVYATDVVAEETRNRDKSPILAYGKTSGQVIVTPHVGGMTEEARGIAFLRAAELLGIYFAHTAAERRA